MKDSNKAFNILPWDAGSLSGLQRGAHQRVVAQFWLYYTTVNKTLCDA